jgi:ketose-bisphosphate aldolase
LPLSDLRNSLSLARSGRYAMPSFNVFNAETLLGALDAASHCGAPLALAIDETHIEYMHFEGFVAMARAVAEQASIPISVHVDHVRRNETVTRAVRAGCNSLLFDGFAMNFEDKIRETRAVADMGHHVGMTIEAELGHVGQLRGREGAEVSEPTNPDQVVEFVERTGIDVVAVSVGSASGMTMQSADLDMSLLEKVVLAAGCFVSMHGGSGVPTDQIRAAVRLGVCKLSVFTRLAAAGLSAGTSYARDLGSSASLPGLSNAMRMGYRDSAIEQLLAWGPPPI